MSILLLGKNGQLGWQLHRRLATLAPIHAVGREDCDLTQITALRHLLDDVRPKTIVNAAAYTAVDRAESESQLAHTLNAAVPELLATWAAQHRATLLHYSTDYVFDGESARPYDEDDIPNPQSVYGLSKWAGEQAIAEAMHADHGGRAFVFRTSWVFGAHGNNFVRTMLRLAGERRELRVVDDQIGCPTPVEFIADISALVLQRLRFPLTEINAPYALYHLCANHAVSWCAFARHILCAAARLGAPLCAQPLTSPHAAVVAITTQDYPTPARRPRNSRLHCQRLATDFSLQIPGWETYLQAILPSLLYSLSQTSPKPNV